MQKACSQWVHCLASIALLYPAGSWGQDHPATAAAGDVDVEFSVAVTIRNDGTATQLWSSGIEISIGSEAASRLAQERIPLTPQAKAWLEILREAVPLAEARGRDLADILELQPIDATIAVGNRGSSDGFGWVPDFIGINVQAFTETYGTPGDGAVDRMARIVAHEYLHLLTYARYPDHSDRRRTPLDRALWTMFFEGIGDYVSVSSRWLPDEHGAYSAAAARVLPELEPVLVQRLESLAQADESRERELRAGISMGRFERKWGSLPVALWLHSEAKQCGERETLRMMLRLERDAVLPLAAKYVRPGLRSRILALQELTGRRNVLFAGDAQVCIASLVGG